VNANPSIIVKSVTKVPLKLYCTRFPHFYTFPNIYICKHDSTFKFGTLSLADFKIEKLQIPILNFILFRVEQLGCAKHLQFWYQRLGDVKSGSWRPCLPPYHVLWNQVSDLIWADVWSSLGIVNTECTFWLMSHSNNIFFGSFLINSYKKEPLPQIRSIYHAQFGK